MKKIAAALLIAGFASAAQAAPPVSNYTWQSRVDGFTIAFPDDWTLQQADTDSTKLRVAGPVVGDMATCNVTVKLDGRVQIYPKPLLPEAAVRRLGQDYWNDEIGRFEGASVVEYRDGTVLGGRGPATAAKATYLQDIGQGKVRMNASMVATIYGEKRYVVMCATREDLFDGYQPMFGKIIGSFQLDSKYHPFATGYYRDFLYEPKPFFQRVGDFFSGMFKRG